MDSLPKTDTSTELTLTALKREEVSIMRTVPSLAMALPIERSAKLDLRMVSVRQTLGYQIAYFKETFSDELWQAMEHRGLNQAQFAEKADVPKQFLTKVFKGGNCTIDTIVKLAHALNYRAHIHLTPNDLACEWVNRIPQNFQRQRMELWVGTAYTNISDVDNEVQNAIVTIKP